MKMTSSRIVSATTALVALIFAGSMIAMAQYSESVLHSFAAPTTAGAGISDNPLVSDGAGNLFGTTWRGGATSNGTFYELVPTSNHGWKQMQLFNFPQPAVLGAAGSPVGGLTRDAAGNFYGLSPYDGIVNCIDSDGYGEACGTIWKLSHTSRGWKRTILYTFQNATDGGTPSSLVMDAAGNLYGLTNQRYGGVFELANNGATRTFSTLYTFSGGADGANPSSILLDRSGNLLGSAYAGGANCSGGCGVLFELSPLPGGGFSESTIYTFTGGNDGGVPYGSIALDANGNLFGIAGPYTNQYPEGIIFELSHSSGGWTESVPYVYTTPMGPLGITSDAAGNLYGSTLFGGPLTLCENGCGTIFSFSPSSSGGTYNTIYTFTGTFDGQSPQVPSIPKGSGNLFVTAQGFQYLAAYGQQTEVWFELSPVSGGTWQGKVVADFPASKDGYNSVASLINDPSDPDVFYGTTRWGGTRGWGTVFRLAGGGPTWTETILYNFLGEADGGIPYGGLRHRLQTIAQWVGSYLQSFGSAHLQKRRRRGESLRGCDA